MRLFVHGSLMSVRSARSTAPHLEADGARPARLNGWRRVWADPTPHQRTVKRYVRIDTLDDDKGFAWTNVVRDEGAWTAGVTYPVDEAALELLDVREHGYVRVDVTDALAPFDADETSLGPCCVYVTDASEAVAPDVSAGYLGLIAQGARMMDQRAPGFLKAVRDGAVGQARGRALRQVVRHGAQILINDEFAAVRRVIADMGEGAASPPLAPALAAAVPDGALAKTIHARARSVDDAKTPGALARLLGEHRLLDICVLARLAPADRRAALAAAHADPWAQAVADGRLAA